VSCFLKAVNEVQLLSSLTPMTTMGHYGLMFKLVDNENNIASLSWTQWAAVATYANLAFCPSGLENENQVYIVS